MAFDRERPQVLSSHGACGIDNGCLLVLHCRLISYSAGVCGAGVLLLS